MQKVDIVEDMLNRQLSLITKYEALSRTKSQRSPTLSKQIQNESTEEVIALANAEDSIKRGLDNEIKTLEQEYTDEILSRENQLKELMASQERIAKRRVENTPEPNMEPKIAEALKAVMSTLTSEFETNSNRMKLLQKTIVDLKKQQSALPYVAFSSTDLNDQLTRVKTEGIAKAAEATTSKETAHGSLREKLKQSIRLTTLSDSEKNTRTHSDPVLIKKAKGIQGIQEALSIRSTTATMFLSDNNLGHSIHQIKTLKIEKIDNFRQILQSLRNDINTQISQNINPNPTILKLEANLHTLEVELLLKELQFSEKINLRSSNLKKLDSKSLAAEQKIFQGAQDEMNHHAKGVLFNQDDRAALKTYGERIAEISKSQTQVSWTKASRPGKES